MINLDIDYTDGLECFIACERFSPLLQVSVSGANYVFAVRFYEFRNPLGLQCGVCGSGGPPACCDDVQRNENCTNVPPLTCDTRFRFLLRPFGAPLETILFPTSLSVMVETVPHSMKVLVGFLVFQTPSPSPTQVNGW